MDILLFEVDMISAWNDIDLQMTLNFEKALVKYKYAGKFCELWNLIHLTMTSIQWPWYSNLTQIL